MLDWLKRRKEIKNASVKQVIVVRTDLKMGKGKLAAQVAHAAVEGYVKVLRLNERVAEIWLREGQKKVVLKAKDIEEIKELCTDAEKEGVPYVLIHDAGLTQVRPGTLTTVAFGPWCENILDKITGHLILL